MSTPFIEKDLELEEEAKRHIIALLEKYGCKTLDLSEPKELSKTPFPIPLKKAMKNCLKTKFDLFVARTHLNEWYIVETKGKRLEKWKTWVNQNSYNAYWKIASFPSPFLYLIWIKENNKIYRHDVIDPKNFEKDFKRRMPIYYIPENLIHEFKPEWIKRLDLCFEIEDVEQLF